MNEDFNWDEDLRVAIASTGDAEFSALVADEMQKVRDGRDETWVLDARAALRGLLGRKSGASITPSSHREVAHSLSRQAADTADRMGVMRFARRPKADA